MKMMGRAGLASGMRVGLVLFFCVVTMRSHADELLLVPPEIRPTNGLFYSFQNPDHPPLPVDLFPELPLYWVENDTFLINDESVDYAELKALWAEAFPAITTDMAMGESSSDCGELTVTTNWTTASDGTVLELVVTGALSGTEVDVFGTYSGFNDAPELYWYWIARVTNDQVLTITNGACWQGWYIAGCTNDTDGDGLTDAYELLVTKTSPDTNHSVNVLFTDAEMENVLVNDLRQDCGNEQNTQFETTCVVSGTNIIVAWVDSNQGVYALGNTNGTFGHLTGYTPQMAGYAVSKDGGRTFEDLGAPPLSLQSASTNDNGNAGDPVLAVDRYSSNVYLVGTSPRNDGYHGIPLWKSTDGGVTFGEATNVLDDVQQSDKPWVTVDDWPGAGQDDVYVAAKGSIDGTNGVWLTVSTNVGVNHWSETLLVREASYCQGIIPVVGPDHVAYMFWLKAENATNWFIGMRQVLDRGAALGEVQEVVSLATTGIPNGDLALKRSSTATNSDTFKVPTLPVPAVNPCCTGYLYVVYADVGTTTNDKADVFLTCSTNGGTNWTSSQRVNNDTTTNDQWMPVLTVKPDGTQLFMAWYDRRSDTNNGLIEVYGRFGVIETNGIVSLANEFKISTTSFPMVFVGTRDELEPTYKEPGYYDPVYPPGDVNLHWWYPEWEPDTPEMGGTHHTGDPGTYERHVGEYNGGFADEQFVYFVWSDYRLAAVGNLVSREQSDVRFVRLAWP